MTLPVEFPLDSTIGAALKKFLDVDDPQQVQRIRKRWRRRRARGLPAPAVVREDGIYRVNEAQVRRFFEDQADSGVDDARFRALKASIRQPPEVRARLRTRRAQ